MSKINKPPKKIALINSKVDQKTNTETSALGRKRDQSLDTKIIEAALDVLAEAGFDNMTMDMVAARAKSGKATVYRRWTSKAELVRDALIQMSQNSVELELLPDNGNLKDDLLAVVKPYSIERGERKLQVLAGLGSFFSAHKDAADEALKGIFEPLHAINRALMQKAVERNEIPEQADIESACRVITSMNYYSSLGERKRFTQNDYAELLDKIILPALKNPPRPD